MSTAPAALMAAFPEQGVLVLGEAMLDAYLHGASGRLCREAPVPIVAVEQRVDVPGGAANTAVNARALGARVSFLSVVGDDPEGATLRTALAQSGIDTAALLVDPGRRTLAKHRVFAGPQMLVRYDAGTTSRVPRAYESRLIEALSASFARHDAVIISDYGYGIVTPRVIAALADLQAASPRIIVADSKTLGVFRGVGVTAVKPNYAETVRLLGGRGAARGADRAEALHRYGPRLLDVTGAQIAAVTLDTDGALFFERGRPPYRTYARPADHTRAAGAGDTFASALALALAAGGDVAATAELASAAAAVVVDKHGTATCSLSELRAYVAGEAKLAPDVPTLLDRLDGARRAGKRIVLTNGCFDILHSGHISYLNAAKALGDVLVVGLNTDAGVRRLKGPSRPINVLEERAAVLAGLSAVDHVVAFDEPTGAELCEAVRPHVFVKGGDYTRQRLPEAAVVEAQGGEVRILPYLKDRSTSSIIERVRAARETAAVGRLA
ncbi:MAG TPA: D-glycero-beta-D-manno-heptose 1-phosphate adenylyltransferase [Methylomirabilota bacterium]|nr:D-glycero-beta-D-manno-heptose 1-phosphate adenylyltransferase [Methylomirabilota bacterium]